MFITRNKHRGGFHLLETVTALAALGFFLMVIIKVVLVTEAYDRKAELHYQARAWMSAQAEEMVAADFASLTIGTSEEIFGEHTGTVEIRNYGNYDADELKEVVVRVQWEDQQGLQSLETSLVKCDK